MWIVPAYPAYEVRVEMEEKLKEILFEADALIVYAEGKPKEIARGCEAYERVTEELAKALKGAREMPALGVALDHLTREFMGYGTGVEFVFEQPREHRGMSFSRLFMRLDRDYYGVNLERFTQGKYQGRCFYLNLERSGNGLFELLLRL